MPRKATRKKPTTDSKKRGAPRKKKSDKKVRVSFTVSPKTLEAMDELAKSMNLPRSRAVELLLEEVYTASKHIESSGLFGSMLEALAQQILDEVDRKITQAITKVGKK